MVGGASTYEGVYCYVYGIYFRPHLTTSHHIII